MLSIFVRHSIVLVLSFIISWSSASANNVNCSFLIDKSVNSSDVAPSSDIEASDQYLFYPGLWYKSHDRHLYQPDVDGLGNIELKTGSVISSVDSALRRGKFPLLPGSKDFYVEVCAKTSNDKPNNWPAIWMLPIEHNYKREARAEGDPPGFERWVEFDIDEGGFGPGVTGTVHNWKGSWPEISAYHNSGNVGKFPVNRVNLHCYGMDYSSELLRVRWYFDGQLTNETPTGFVDPVARLQNYYLILYNQVRDVSNGGYTFIVDHVSVKSCTR